MNLLNAIGIFYDKYIKNNNYTFTKEQTEAMCEVSINYKKMNNTQLSIKISFIFDYHYSIDTIKYILNTYNEPIRAFVLYKISNTLFNNNLNKFEYINLKVMDIILYTVLILSSFLILKPLVYQLIIFFPNETNKFINIFSNIGNLGTLILAMAMIIFVIQSLLKQRYSVLLLELEKKTKTLDINKKNIIELITQYNNQLTDKKNLAIFKGKNKKRYLKNKKIIHKLINKLR